jgi:flagellar hook-basal body complex protein FliE
MAILPVGPAGLIPADAAAALPQTQPAGKASFVDVVEKILADANVQQLQSDQAIRELAAGQTDNLHEVLLTVAKADLSFRTILEVRNRLTEAYQEVMRMQV